MQKWMVLAIIASVLLGIWAIMNKPVNRESESPEPFSRTRVAFANAFGAIDAYQLNLERLPDSLAELLDREKFADPAHSPFLRDHRFLLDSWGIPIRYEPSTNGYVLRSAGPDRLFNTTDDLTEKRAARSRQRQ